MGSILGPTPSALRARLQGWSQGAFPLLAGSALVSFLLATLMGGIVRVTGSGLGCPDWPLCHGRIIPPPDIHAWLEYLHRLAVAVSTVFLVLMSIAGWGWARSRGQRVLALLPGGLLVVQVALGAFTVLTELHGLVALAHTGVAMALLGSLAVVTAQTTLGVRGLGDALRRDGDYRLALLALGVTAFLLILTGAYVTRSGAALACVPFPLCNRPPATLEVARLQEVDRLHWASAVLVGVLVAWVSVRAFRASARGVVALTLPLTLLAVVQIAFGIANKVWLLPTWSRVAHLIGAAGVFTWAFFLVGVAWQVAARPGPTLLQEARGLLLLTKPGVIVLLLVTTLGGMLAAGGGRVAWERVVVTLIAGALCAGGAGALNSYLDRSLDAQMARTRRRPLPAGVVGPEEALWFGISLGAVSLAMFVLWVNALSALLAGIAFLFYVVVYSFILKRRTPQNIVLGGAAGAFPPLIGWTAVTGRMEPSALFLFLIVFFWTPPHFWPLALVAREDYRSAQVPMLPVVAGERASAFQVLLYTLILLGVSILPAALRLLGPVYLASAVVLGLVFLGMALALYRRPTPQTALRLYRYSNLYLALLFLFLVVDRSLAGA
ncbi:Protoheme IX farnesyltransferase [bacterium HR23]|nr:Protoheme IX farnesyltransferase [bacterium HR23]